MYVYKRILALTRELFSARGFFYQRDMMLNTHRIITGCFLVLLLVTKYFAIKNRASNE